MPEVWSAKGDSSLKACAHKDVRAEGITCIRQLAFCMCCARQVVREGAHTRRPGHPMQPVFRVRVRAQDISLTCSHILHLLRTLLFGECVCVKRIRGKEENISRTLAALASRVKEIIYR